MNKQGFTLIELVIAIALASILFMALLSMLSTSSQFNKKTSERQAINLYAQEILETMRSKGVFFDATWTTTPDPSVSGVKTHTKTQSIMGVPYTIQIVERLVSEKLLYTGTISKYSVTFLPDSTTRVVFGADQHLTIDGVRTDRLFTPETVDNKNIYRIYLAKNANSARPFNFQNDLPEANGVPHVFLINIPTGNVTLAGNTNTQLEALGNGFAFVDGKLSEDIILSKKMIEYEETLTIMLGTRQMIQPLVATRLEYE